MAEEESKKDDKDLEFTSEGETFGYVSLDQARVLALQHARDNREIYGMYADTSNIPNLTSHLTTDGHQECTVGLFLAFLQLSSV